MDAGGGARAGDRGARRDRRTRPSDRCAMRGSGRVAISVAVFLVACPSPERFPGEGLIAGFERKQHWLSVFGGHGATLFQLVDMKQFGDFTPGQVPEATGIAVG